MARAVEHAAGSPGKDEERVGGAVYLLFWVLGLVGLALLLTWALMVFAR